MPTKMTYNEWFLRLGNPVPLKLVPSALGITAREVATAIVKQQIKVYTFVTDDGTVHRMVRRDDLQAFGKNPLTHPNLPGVITQAGMNRAFRIMLEGRGKPKRKRHARLPWAGTARVIDANGKPINRGGQNNRGKRAA